MVLLSLLVLAPHAWCSCDDTDEPATSRPPIRFVVHAGPVVALPDGRLVDVDRFAEIVEASDIAWGEHRIVLATREEPPYPRAAAAAEVLLAAAVDADDVVFEEIDDGDRPSTSTRREDGDEVTFSDLIDGAAYGLHGAPTDDEAERAEIGRRLLDALAARELDAFLALPTEASVAPLDRADFDRCLAAAAHVELDTFERFEFRPPNSLIAHFGDGWRYSIGVNETANNDPTFIWSFMAVSRAWFPDVSTDDPDPERADVVAAREIAAALLADDRAAFDRHVAVGTPDDVYARSRVPVVRAAVLGSPPRGDELTVTRATGPDDAKLLDVEAPGARVTFTIPLARRDGAWRLVEVVGVTRNRVTISLGKTLEELEQRLADAFAESDEPTGGSVRLSVRPGPRVELDDGRVLDVEAFAGALRRSDTAWGERRVVLAPAEGASYPELVEVIDVLLVAGVTDIVVVDRDG